MAVLVVYQHPMWQVHVVVTLLGLVWVLEEELVILLVQNQMPHVVILVMQLSHLVMESDVQL